MRPSQECINQYTTDTSQGIGRLAALNVINWHLSSGNLMVDNKFSERFLLISKAGKNVLPCFDVGAVKRSYQSQ